MKLTFLVAIGVCITCGCQADTKVLAHINNIIPGSAIREETISLENDEDLAVKGIYEVKHQIPNDPNSVLVATVRYVSDKNGYHANYTLTREMMNFILHLSPMTLMSLAG